MYFRCARTLFRWGRVNRSFRPPRMAARQPEHLIRLSSGGALQGGRAIGLSRTEMSGEIALRRQMVMQTESNEQRLSDTVEMGKAAPGERHTSIPWLLT